MIEFDSVSALSLSQQYFCYGGTPAKEESGKKNGIYASSKSDLILPTSQIQKKDF